MSPQPIEIPGLKRQLPQSSPIDRDASVKRTALDAEASTFYPQEFLTSLTADNMMAVDAYVDQSGCSQFDPCYYVASSLPINSQDYSSQLLKEFKEEDFHVVAAAVEVEVEVVQRPLGIHPKALVIPSTQVNSTTEGATTSISSSDRHLLPSPPSTPSLGSSPRFPSNFAPSTPNRGPSTPATTPTSTLVRNNAVFALVGFEYFSHRYQGGKNKTRKPKPKPKRSLIFPHTKNNNPFIDFREVNGNTTAEMYYKTRSFLYGEVLVKKPKVGPFRNAAVYEFIGQTFEKGNRKLEKTSHHKRHKAYRTGQDCFAEGSNLRYVMTMDEDKEDKDVEMGDADWPDRWDD